MNAPGPPAARAIAARGGEEVLAALGERRERDGDDREPVEEVLAELAAAHAAREVGPRRRDEARPEGGLARAADAPHEALLDDAQELALRAQRQGVDPVEVEGPGARALEEARLSARRRP